jgi:hypothetical protein
LGCGGGVELLFLDLFLKKFETLYKETGESI